MITTADQIAIVLSGGSSNSDPNLSLGGEPSGTALQDSTINNLFEDISSEVQEVGYEDYRCFYIFNDGEAAIYNLKIWIIDETEGGGSIEMGIKSFKEVQRISITPIPTTGSMTLSYEGENFISNTNSNLGLWSNELENTLNDLDPLLKETSVSAQQLSNQIVFDIDFGEGYDGKRNHDLVTHVSNDFNTSSDVATTVIQEGSPINAIAELIDNSQVPPNNVGFFKPTFNSPISLLRLMPSEGFPIWTKRLILPSGEPVEQDSFTFRMRADSLPA